MGIVRTGQRMAAPANPISLLDKICPLFYILVLQIEGIDRKPAVRISSPSGKKSVYFVLRDKNIMLLPLKTFPGLIRNGFLGEFLKPCQHTGRVIHLKPHHRFIFLIDFLQSRKPFIQIT